MRAGQLSALLLLGSSCSIKDPGWTYDARDTTLATSTGQHISAHVSANAFAGTLRAHVFLRNSEAGAATIPALQMRIFDKRGVVLHQRYREHSTCIVPDGSIKIAAGLACKVDALFDIRPLVGIVVENPNPDLLTVRLTLAERQAPNPVVLDVTLTH
jgi:hypothetical protein